MDGIGKYCIKWGTPERCSTCSRSLVNLILNVVDWCLIWDVWRALLATPDLGDADSEEAEGRKGE